MPEEKKSIVDKWLDRLAARRKEREEKRAERDFIKEQEEKGFTTESRKSRYGGTHRRSRKLDVLILIALLVLIGLWLLVLFV